MTDMVPEGDPRDGDIRTRVNSLEHATTLHEQRVTALEHWRTHSDIDDARKEGAWANMKEKLDNLTTSIGEIQGTLRWIGRLIIGGIVAGIIAFVIKGGLNIPPL